MGASLTSGTNDGVNLALNPVLTDHSIFGQSGHSREVNVDVSFLDGVYVRVATEW